LRRDLRGRTPLLTCGALKLDPASQRAWKHKQLLSLTRKEYAILEYLMRRPGEVVSQEELLEHVWDAHVNPFTNVVRVHITSLRKKLGERTGASGVIEAVIGAGYRLIADPDEEHAS
jgi:DNA-binding response OmpR family regulator